MDSRQWVNPSQPQTLTIACFLLYINAVFAVLNLLRSVGGPAGLGLVGGLYYLLTIGGGALAGHGVATERKWGYGLAIVVALVPFALGLYVFGNPLAGDLISLIFEIALVALLLHPLSRSYQKIWFR